MQPEIMKFFWLWTILKKSKLKKLIWSLIFLDDNLTSIFIYFWQVQAFVIRFSMSRPRLVEILITPWIIQWFHFLDDEFRVLQLYIPTLTELHGLTLG